MLDKLKKIDWPGLVIWLAFTFGVTMCSHQIYNNITSNYYLDAKNYYENNTCAKKDCTEPDVECREYCYKRDVLGIKK